jgi:recombinational DNA repair protein (RecF pathway)
MPRMIEILDKQTGRPVGSLSEEQFQFLVDQLEEESATDDDYYLNRATVDFLEEQGADPALVAVLRTALGSADETEIRWQRSA